jgi:hypothetical protein
MQASPAVRKEEASAPVMAAVPRVPDGAAPVFATETRSGMLDWPTTTLPKSCVLVPGVNTPELGGAVSVAVPESGCTDSGLPEHAQAQRTQMGRSVRVYVIWKILRSRH